MPIERNGKTLMPVSELRRDLVSGDWIVIATARAKRPHAFVRPHTHERSYTRLRSCPFEKPQESGNELPIAAFDARGRSLAGERAVRDWFIQVIPNKFPAFTPGMPRRWRLGIFEGMSGAGHHELVLMRPHDRHWGHYSLREAKTIFRAYRDRYCALSQEPFVEYIALFHNFGKDAGASIYHPHSQIIAIPAIPTDVRRSFVGARRYFRAHSRCVHCTMIAWERRNRARIVSENDSFIALCPFASRSAFEVRIFPKRHEPRFWNVSERELEDASGALRTILGRIRRKLGDPPYNFFFHTAPPSNARRFSYYHWHIEIIPKLSVWAGFEIATGIEISTIAPEQAAVFLRGKR